MEKLVDPSLSDETFVELLNQVLHVMHNPTNVEEQKVAQSVLTQFLELPNSWVRCDKVLDSPKASSMAKFYALQVLGEMIKYRWKTLPRETCESIRNYVVGKIISVSSDEATMQKDQVYIQKLDEVLVQIVKQEWPDHWRNFIPEILGASRTSTSQCENNLKILSLLSEEVFQFSAGQMTQEKTVHLKNQFNEEFSQVFQLCQFVFEQSATLQEARPSLLLAMLETLEKFLTWIPLGYVFETQLIESLASYLSVPALRNAALKCIVEVGSLSVGNVYDARFSVLYKLVMMQLATTVPIATDIAQAYETADDYTQAFVMDLALFFSGYFKSHLKSLEGSSDVEIREAQRPLGMQYMLKISAVSDVEIFKTCVDWWHTFTSDLYLSSRVTAAAVANSARMEPEVRNPRWNMYGVLLSELRRIMIERMAKPEEVLIVEDENGEIVREASKDTDAIALYKTMKETLVYLTHLDPADTEAIMLKKLATQAGGSQWTWNGLNTLCWAIGSISGAMSETEEKTFLVTVIKDLLHLCEITRGKDNKAVVASNIMYVVGQYPRFLRAHWKFLKTVVKKQFEFMHETHPGVQDMACDTFMKIAQKCRKKFMYTQPGETRPFIVEMLDNVSDIIAELEPHQVHSFYESCGYIIAEPSSRDMCRHLVPKLFMLPNESWQEVLYKANVNMEVLKDRQTMKSLINILKTNTHVARSLGSPYYIQLEWMFKEMLMLYVAYSKALASLIQTGGPQMTKSADARYMRGVKKEVLAVLEAFFSNKSACKNASLMGNIIDTTVISVVIEPMTEPIVRDYYDSVPDVRDAEVLSLFAQIIVCTNGLPVGAVRLIFKSLFACTLEMIKNNFEDYPDARLNFFKLLRAINQHNFKELFVLDDNPAAAEADFKLVINAIIWAFKHTERNVAETGLVSLLELLVNVDKSAHIDYFYRTCFRLILNDILSVLTDTLHRPGFQYQAKVLMHMLAVVSAGKVREPMWNPNNPEEVAAAGSMPSNQVFVVWHLETLLAQAFPNLRRAQIQVSVKNLFESLNNPLTFKNHLRDFLIQTKEFSSGDNTDLFDEERQAEVAEQQRREQERLRSTPGLIAPAVDDTMTET